MRIASPPPVMCSGCHGQYPGRLHVDFEAVWDGPVIDVSGTTYSVDDLHLCETCILAARALLPDDETQRLAFEELQFAHGEVLDYVAKLQSSITVLESALAAKPLAPPEAVPVMVAPRASVVQEAHDELFEDEGFSARTFDPEPEAEEL